MIGVARPCVLRCVEGLFLGINLAMRRKQIGVIVFITRLFVRQVTRIVIYLWVAFKVVFFPENNYIIDNF
jgi:hypothetical protein